MCGGRRLRVAWSGWWSTWCCPRHHPGSESGYVISVGVCEGEWDLYAEGMEEVFGSFVEE